MVIPRKLKQLHSIRFAEEELIETEVNAELVELGRLRNGLERAGERLRRAQMLIASSAEFGKPEDRVAGLQEASLANRLARLLAGQIQAAEERFAQLRSRFLAKRIERRQVGTLLEEAQHEVEIENTRTAQRGFDEWARSKASPRPGSRRNCA